MNIPDDNILLDLFRKGNEQSALDGFYRRYGHLVYGVCLKYLKNRDNSLDATSEVFVQLADKISKYEITNFNSWIYSLSKNHCLMILRKNKQKHNQIQFNPDYVNAKIEDANYDVVEDLDINSAIMQLSIKQQKCIRLFYFEKKKYAEISEETGFPIKKVKSYLQNGRIKLKNILKNQMP